MLFIQVLKIAQYLTLKNSVGKISLTMDIWSDTNLSPFMGVTAHWIDMTEINTPGGIRTTLKLKAYIIGFHRIPGRHTGQHLAQTLRFIVDRIGISSKVSFSLYFKFFILKFLEARMDYDGQCV